MTASKDTLKKMSLEEAAKDFHARFDLSVDTVCEKLAELEKTSYANCARIIPPGTDKPAFLREELLYLKEVVDAENPQLIAKKHDGIVLYNGGDSFLKWIDHFYSAISDIVIDYINSGNKPANTPAIDLMTKINMNLLQMKLELNNGYLETLGTILFTERQSRETVEPAQEVTFSGKNSEETTPSKTDTLTLPQRIGEFKEKFEPVLTELREMLKRIESARGSAFAVDSKPRATFSLYKELGRLLEGMNTENPRPIEQTHQGRILYSGGNEFVWWIRMKILPQMQDTGNPTIEEAKGILENTLLKGWGDGYLQSLGEALKAAQPARENGAGAATVSSPRR